MYSVNQHWDKLNVCAVGSVYPPEFYSFIPNAKVRNVMERISLDTEEDYQKLISFLKTNHVEVVRTQIKNNALLAGKLLPPPLSPRDHFAMIGDKFYAPTPLRHRNWNLVRKQIYPLTPPDSIEAFESLHKVVKLDLDKNHNVKNLFDCYSFDYSSLATIVNLVEAQGNEIILDKNIDSAMTCRVGKDLYFGTWPGQNPDLLLKEMQLLFPEYRCHIVKTDGHLDGVFTPIKEGLILCRKDYINLINFDQLFPGWEVVPVQSESFQKNRGFKYIKYKNAGKWWVPGEEYNDDFTQFVNLYMDHCVGNIEETNIGVNVLMLDENNLICSEEDDKIFKILNTYNITPHVIPIRHFYFWDNGTHCLTCDLDRSGKSKDYFPERQY